METETKLLTVPEAARVLRVAPATLYAWCRQRRIPHVRLGDRIFLDAAAIIASAHVPAEADVAAAEFANRTKLPSLVSGGVR